MRTIRNLEFALEGPSGCCNTHPQSVEFPYKENRLLRQIRHFQHFLQNQLLSALVLDHLQITFIFNQNINPISSCVFSGFACSWKKTNVWIFSEISRNIVEVQPSRVPSKHGKPVGRSVLTIKCPMLQNCHCLHRYLQYIVQWWGTF